jgi:hypothetical protein
MSKWLYLSVRFDNLVTQKIIIGTVRVWTRNPIIIIGTREIAGENN